MRLSLIVSAVAAAFGIGAPFRGLMAGLAVLGLERLRRAVS